MYTNLRNLEQNPALAQALGNMVVAWSNAERALQTVLVTITDLSWSMATAGYFNIPTFESRVRFLLALAENSQSEKYDRRAIVIKISKLRDLAQKRNFWVHNFWGGTLTGRETVLFNFRAASGTSGRRTPVKAADVINHYKAVNRHTDELMDLLRSKD